MELSFDAIFHQVCDLWAKVPLLGGLGPRFDGYYKTHTWFQRFIKFGVTTTLIYWVIKGPLIWVFTGLIPNINLFLFVVPSYLTAGFVVGLVVTLVGFALNEAWIWKQRR